MTEMVRFPEARTFLIDHGFSVSKASKITKVARNTLTAMRKGEEVSLNSAAKLITGFEAAGLDVSEIRAALQRRLDADQAVAANAGAHHLSVVERRDFHRSTARIAADVRDAQAKSQILTEELVRSLDGGDKEVERDILLDIKRHHKKALLDLEHAFRVLGVDLD